MHEFSKKIGEHIKSCYSDFHSMTREELEEMMCFAKTMASLTEFDKNIRVIKAMDEEEKMDEMDRMGYNMNRDSRGRFRSGRRGYMPYPYMEDDDYMNSYLNDPKEFARMMRHGYDDGVNGNPGNLAGANRNGGSRYGYNERSRHTEAYDEWKNARRHYTETHDMNSKQKMDDQTKKHVDDTIDSMREMWNESDNIPMKQQIKQKLAELINTMNV